MKKELNKAKDYALRLLSYRSRSEKELRDRLSGKGYAGEIVEKVVEGLKGLSLINDRKFAQAWVEERFLHNPRGERALKRELYLKGVDEEIVEEVIRDAFSRRSEYEIVRELAGKRVKRYKGLEVPSAKRRIYGFLSRRGFNPGVIQEVLEELFAEQELE